MIVTAMLAWWDEPADELRECVRSLAVLCDRVVAVDGAWKMTPRPRPASPPEQAEAIEQAAAEVGLEAIVVVPNDIWEGQVAKRDAMIRIASDGSDWVIATDADHRLVGDRDAVRGELERTKVDSILHDFHTPVPPGVSVRAASPHRWHKQLANRTIEHSLLMRCFPDMRVEDCHWGYSGVKSGRRIGLCRWRGKYPAGKLARLDVPFRVDHLCFGRDQERLERNRAYCKARDSFVSRQRYEP